MVVGGRLNFLVTHADILLDSDDNNKIQGPKMKDRRLFPRFDVILPVKLSTEGGTVEANVFDISMGGMQLGCDREAAEILVPTHNQVVNPGQNLVVTASFRCPGGNGVSVKCRLVVSRRISNNEFRIGMEYMEFASDAEQESYDAYIRERMAEELA